MLPSMPTLLQAAVFSSPPSHALLLTSRPSPGCLPSLGMSCLTAPPARIQPCLKGLVHSLPFLDAFSDPPAFPPSSCRSCPPLLRACRDHHTEPRDPPKSLKKGRAVGQRQKVSSFSSASYTCLAPVSALKMFPG